MCWQRERRKYLFVEPSFCCCCNACLIVICLFMSTRDRTFRVAVWTISMNARVPRPRQAGSPRGRSGLRSAGGNSLRELKFGSRSVRSCQNFRICQLAVFLFEQGFEKIGRIQSPQRGECKSTPWVVNPIETGANRHHASVTSYEIQLVSFRRNACQSTEPPWTVIFEFPFTI